MALIFDFDEPTIEIGELANELDLSPFRYSRQIITSSIVDDLFSEISL
jgi:hypothetical protein